jgi:hypothetical protein
MWRFLTILHKKYLVTLYSIDSVQSQRNKAIIFSFWRIFFN